MFEVLKVAGVRPSDVSRLLNVNRVTVSLWVNGHSLPHKFIDRRVKRLLGAVQSAVDMGDLPVSADVPRPNRHNEVARAVHKHLDLKGLGPVAE